jgi:V/A-type H+/Na+-transporting ATPase subunit I
MFSAAPMMRLQAVVLERDERAVLTGLGRLGAMQLTRARSGPDTMPLGSLDRTSELARCDRIMTRIDELRQSLEIPPMPKLPQPTQLTLDGAEERLRPIEQQAGDLLGQRRRLAERQKELAGTCKQVSWYRGLDIPLDGLDRYSFLHFVTGSLPAQNLEALEKEVGEKVALLPLAQEKARQSLLAISTRQGRPELERALQGAGFEHENLPIVEGTTVDGLSEEGEREQERLAQEWAQLNGKLKTVAAGFAPSLAEIEVFVDVERRLLDAGQHFSRTDSTILLTGWVPAADVAALEERLKEVTGGRYVIQTAMPESGEEEVPVLLRHSRLLRPFEMLVSTYGLPDYRELEPTLFVALSYVVMFGMMFGDVGHGAVLAACGIVALLAGKSRKVRDVGVLLLFGGSSSIIFGVVYGSYFGIEAFKHYALWHDPLEGDPMQLMYGAIGLGIAIISIGLILNVINRFRRGDVIGAILDKFGLVGLLFYWGILFLLMNVATIRSRGLMTASLILFVVVPIVGWSLKEPLEHLSHHAGGHGSAATGGLGGAIAESCVGAFEAILSYLANTISFVRLAAYAMSHAALLFAAFMVASEVKTFPFGGGVFAIMVIILGNLVAIVLEGIIASVQALRLEYYEFFGKFFSGSGQPFEPFFLAGDGNSAERQPGGQ